MENCQNLTVDKVKQPFFVRFQTNPPLFHLEKVAEQVLENKLGGQLADMISSTQWPVCIQANYQSTWIYLNPNMCS